MRPGRCSSAPHWCPDTRPPSPPGSDVTPAPPAPWVSRPRWPAASGHSAPGRRSPARCAAPSRPDTAGRKMPSAAAVPAWPGRWPADRPDAPPPSCHRARSAFSAPSCTSPSPSGRPFSPSRFPRPLRCPPGGRRAAPPPWHPSRSGPPAGNSADGQPPLQSGRRRRPAPAGSSP